MYEVLDIIGKKTKIEALGKGLVSL